MDSGDIDLSDLRDLLASRGERSAYVRALLRRGECGWTLRRAVVLVGVEPPNWEEATWQYEDVALVAIWVPSPSLALLWAAGPDALIQLDGADVEVPAVAYPAHWRRDPSFSRHALVPRPYSTTTYTIAPQDHDSGAWPTGMLVGTGCPSFPEHQSAWRAFSEGDFSLAGAPAPQSDLVVIHVADTRGWIGPVHVRATHMTVEVCGDALDGCELELYGTTNRSAHRLDGPGTVTIRLPAGLPDQAWLWLKSGTTWFDYRSIDPNSGWTGDLGRAGVEIDVPMDVQASVEALIAAGEGPQVEFKGELVAGRKLKTVAAFANREGGTIVFGIDRDEVTVTGLNGDDPTKLRDQLADKIRAAVIPTPDFTVYSHTFDGKTILLAQIQPGKTTLYGIISSSNSRDKPDYYIRRGASTYPAQPNDIREAVVNQLNRTDPFSRNWHSPSGYARYT